MSAIDFFMGSALRGGAVLLKTLEITFFFGWKTNETQICLLWASLLLLYVNAHLNLKSFQVSTLEQMLSTGRQSASDENETDPESRQFHSWKGNKGAAEILLPDVETEKE